MAEIRIQARAAAPLQTVWSVLAAQAGMGAIRVLSRPPFKIREQITDVDGPVRLTYRMLSGLPVRDYTGETILSDRDGATDIIWKVTMTARLPGSTIVVRRVIRALVNGLVAESQRIAGQEGQP